MAATLKRTTLTDTRWETIGPHCLGWDCDDSRTAPNPRLSVVAVLWVVQRVCP